MKANELQIGDWGDLSEADEMIPCKVVGIMPEELYEIQPNDTACDIIGYDMIRPIPLTAEILEENGWRLVENEYRSPEDIAYKESLRLQIGEDGNAFWWIVGYVIVIPINYVHELQHTLRSCGLKELADNFKV